MSNATHTPAPWHLNGHNLAQVIKINDGPDRQGHTHVDGRHQVLVANAGSDHQMPWAERLANARLIAEAPAMLCELERELAWLEHVRPQVTAPSSVLTGFDQATKAIRTAIAKATGGRPA